MGFVRCWPLIVVLLLFPSVIAAPPTHSTNVVVMTLEGEDNHVSSCQLLILVRPLIVLAFEDTLGIATLRARETMADVVIRNVDLSRASCDISVDRVLARFDTAVSPIITGATVVGPGPATLEAGVRVIMPGSETNDVSVCQHVVLIQPIIIGGPAYGVDVNPSSDIMEFIHGGNHCQTRVGRVDIEQPAT